MKLYQVEFENERLYEDYEHYTCGIFESHEKAVEYCLSNGYVESSTKDLFEKKDEYWMHDFCLWIYEIEMNEELQKPE